MYLRELRVSYHRVRARSMTAGGDLRLNSPRAAAHLITQLIGHEAVEVAILLCLTAQHELLSFHRLSRGGLTATIVEAREVFKVALLANAAAVIVGHNHPSGDPKPSDEDLAVTFRLVTAGQVIGVTLLDHIIIAGDQHVSLRELST